jgi:hypothetical protein
VIRQSKTDVVLQLLSLFARKEFLPMSQAELNRAVARATGETVTTVEQLGFSLMVVPETDALARKPRRFGGSARSKGKRNRVSRVTHACRLG